MLLYDTTTCEGFILHIWELQEVALANEKVEAEIDGKEIVKVIAVPNKLGLPTS